MRFRTLLMTTGGALALASASFAGPPGAPENPPTGIWPSDFATQYSGCLGPLRSAIAQGQFAGVGPFGEHFTGQVDPGSHQGTVGEQELLETVIGIPADQLQAFCAQFATH